MSDSDHTGRDEETSVGGPKAGKVVPRSIVTDQDVYLFNEGTHQKLYNAFGAHPVRFDDVDGTSFAVWAPNAQQVSVIGDFNGWDGRKHPLVVRGSSGIWEGFIPNVGKGTVYKYRVVGPAGRHVVDKADPFGLMHECPPRTASVVWDIDDYEWSDDAWCAQDRGGESAFQSPIAVYEVHLGSWRRKQAEDGSWVSLSYRELAEQLTDYVKENGFTHVELLPVMEHPFFGSWGYQVTGYFAPTSRHGTPQDLMYLIDKLHQNGIGVIMDWVPSHFPTDGHGLAYFDGTHLYEHADPRQGFHPDWQSFIFNYGRHEVRSFLLSSAHMWVDRYHADGLRIDGVASMLYLNYSREEGDWIPNEYGGNENLEAVSLLKQLNETLLVAHPRTMTIAEESTAWPMVTRPPYIGGLGFSFKWDMGWMHDTLEYFQHDPIHRRYHLDKLTFRRIYAYTENFVLSLSHDEVVHGKGSLLGKMPGDRWQQLANLRLLHALMYTTPGKKMLFMGGEFGQIGEWNHDGSLEWHLLDDPAHAGVRQLMGDLNRLLKDEPALHRLDHQPEGFDWVDCSDVDQCIVSFVRRGEGGDPTLLVMANFTPVPRHNYRVGVPHGGRWIELLNTDAPLYGGSGQGNLGGREAVPVPWNGQQRSLNVTLPPLGLVIFKPEEH
jgi:1,4-alpha-glucan branching enzyme